MPATRVGLEKGAAKKCGVAVDEYRRRIAAGSKWCTGCKEWHKREQFRSDATRFDGLAAICQNARKLKRKGVGRKNRPDPQKERARGLIRSMVLRGAIPRPDDIPCSDCGHIGHGFRHEYDHHRGYDGDNAGEVQAVCALCHRRREKARRING